MERLKQLNKYQKIRLVLLLIIIVEIIVFAISTVKTYETNKQSANQEELYAENEEEIEDEDENETEDDDDSWDEEDVEDTEVDMEDEENSEENNSAKYYLKVNYTANVVTVYSKDSEGKYTIPVKAMVCSTGTATPRSGVYATSNKYRWHELNGGVYGQYCTRITGHILFHSVPYKTNSPDSLKYTAYDKLGTAASAGCIRLTVEDALWIYTNCASGTYVEFYSSTDPGPLGKPTAQKISSVTECRNWDPTDPDSRNPWHTYTGSTSTSSSETTTTESENSSETATTQEETQSTSTQPSSSSTEIEEKEENKSTENNSNNTNTNNNNTNTNTSNTSVNNTNANNTISEENVSEDENDTNTKTNTNTT